MELHPTLVGSLSSGGQCPIVSSTSLDFYPQYVPPLNTYIVASYRGYGRSVAEVVNSVVVESAKWRRQRSTGDCKAVKLPARGRRRIAKTQQ